MKHTHQHRFAYPLADIVSRFLDADFLCQMMCDLGARDVEVAVEPQDDDRVHVHIQRTVATEAPALIRSVAGNWVELDQQEVWSGLTSAGDDAAEIIAELTIDAVGKPAKGGGQLRFRADGDGHTQCDASVEVTCSVPLVASMVERLMIDDSMALLVNQFAYVETALLDSAAA